MIDLNLRVRDCSYAAASLPQSMAVTNGSLFCRGATRQRLSNVWLSYPAICARYTTRFRDRVAFRRACLLAAMSRRPQKGHLAYRNSRFSGFDIFARGVIIESRRQEDGCYTQRDALNITSSLPPASIFKAMKMISALSIGHAIFQPRRKVSADIS